MVAEVPEVPDEVVTATVALALGTITHDDVKSSTNTFPGSTLSKKVTAGAKQPETANGPMRRPAKQSLRKIPKKQPPKELGTLTRTRHSMTTLSLSLSPKKEALLAMHNNQLRKRIPQNPTPTTLQNKLPRNLRALVSRKHVLPTKVLRRTRSGRELRR